MSEAANEDTRRRGRRLTGDRSDVEDLVPLVYDELRRLARRFLQGERADHTLQPTALVHEAYLRLAKTSLPLQSRSHFFAIAARVMRRVLVDHARSHRSAKRGGSAFKVPLDEARGMSEGEEPVDLIALNEAIERLEELDPRQSHAIDLRFFGGLTLAETAEVLGISVPVVVREIRAAKAWLYNELVGG